MELLVEVINQGPRLYLFGAGHVAQALCRVLEGTPFTVDLSTSARSGWTITGFHRPSEHPSSWSEFVESALWSNERTFVAVMTHRHDLDEEIIRHVASRPARYIGLIGSRAKWARFRQRLEQRGIAADALDRVRCPIGLPVGGKAPQEVAISIAAELLPVVPRGEVVASAGNRRLLGVATIDSKSAGSVRPPIAEAERRPRRRPRTRESGRLRSIETKIAPLTARKFAGASRLPATGSGPSLNRLGSTEMEIMCGRTAGRKSPGPSFRSAAR